MRNNRDVCLIAKDSNQKKSREPLLVGPVPLMELLESKINRGKQTKYWARNHSSCPNTATNKFCDSEQVL